MIHWELCKKFEFDYKNKWYMHNLESVQENEMHKILWDLEIQMDHLITARLPDQEIINKIKKGKKKKRICRIVDIAVPADNKVKLKESVKRDKKQDLAREPEKLWNMKVTMISVVIGGLGTVTKGLVQGLEDQEIRGRVEINQIKSLLRSAQILRSVLETWEDLLSLKFQWKTISWRWCEKLSRSK